MRYEKSFTLGSGDSGKALADVLASAAKHLGVTEAEAIRVAIRTLGLELEKTQKKSPNPKAA